MAHASNAGLEEAGRPDVKECIDVLDILALCWGELDTGQINLILPSPFNQRVRRAFSPGGAPASIMWINH